jgi:hypothetical protein
VNNASSGNHRSSYYKIAAARVRKRGFELTKAVAKAAK